MVFGKTPLYRLWKGRMSAFWRRRRLMKLLRLAAVPEGARILEAGCGEGKVFAGAARPWGSLDSNSVTDSPPLSGFAAVFGGCGTQ